MIQGKTSTKPAATEAPVDDRPWRKRHPVLSRAILYSLGLALGVVLVVAYSDRKDDDRATELEAIQKQIDGLSLVLAADPTGDRLLAILDESFAGEDLPVRARERSLRWRAMAWRRKAETAETDADRDAAFAKADAAYEAARALDMAADERFAMQLERTEALLLRRDLKGARAALPPLEQASTVSAALMRQFLLAQLVRLEDGNEKACAILRATLNGIEAPMPTETDAYIGGREWKATQIAVEMANFVTSQGQRPADAQLWKRLRTLGADEYEVQKAAALGLLALGAEDDAVAAWRVARALDGRLAALECARQAELGRLDRAATRP